MRYLAHCLDTSRFIAINIFVILSSVDACHADWFDESLWQLLSKVFFSLPIFRTLKRHLLEPYFRRTYPNNRRLRNSWHLRFFGGRIFHLIIVNIWNFEIVDDPLINLLYSLEQLYSKRVSILLTTKHTVAKVYIKNKGKGVQRMN